MESREPGSGRIRLDISYDGTHFNGWARQPHQRTVEGVLEEGLASIFRRSGVQPRLVVAGRTDVGVHAVGQVAHVDLTAAQMAALNKAVRGHPHAITGAVSLASRLNGVNGLSSDVRVDASSLAPAGFDARFSALWRRYEYRIADTAAAHDPRRRTHTLWYPGALNDNAMQDAAQSLLGLHDFASFCRPRPGATTIRTLQAYDWDRADDGVLRARLQADAFCHSMVRALVGACVDAPDRAAEVRDGAKRTNAFKVMPAKGLTLLAVGYPPDAELGARAELTRARRQVVE
ncbi:MAG: tRNA pseudouridine synthase A [Pseudolysinimonas sp.]